MVEGGVEEREEEAEEVVEETGEVELEEELAYIVARGGRAAILADWWVSVTGGAGNTVAAGRHVQTLGAHVSGVSRLP